MMVNNFKAYRFHGLLWVVIPCILAGVYIISFRFNGLLDMPNHMARAFIMLKCLTDPGNQVCSNFAVSAIPIPYFFADLTLMAYLTVFPPFIAEKISIFVLLVMFVISWYVLYKRVNGEMNVGYVAGLALALNNYLYNGFYAYLLSIVLALGWLSFWWPIRDKKTIANQISLGLGMAMIFGFHLAGFLFVFIIYLMYDIYKLFLNRQEKVRFSPGTVMTSLSMFIVFVGLYLFQQMMTGNSVSTPVHYKDFIHKVATVFYPFINYEKHFDMIIVLMILAVLISAIDYRFFHKLYKNFWVTVSLAFFMLFFITPTVAHGVYDFDSRFLPIAYLSLFLAVGAVTKKNRVYSHAVTILLIVSFMVSMYYKNIQDDQLLKVFNILKSVPEKSSLIEINSIKNYPDKDNSRVNPFPYLSCYYILDGGALVNGLFDSLSNNNLKYFSYSNKEIQTMSCQFYQFLGAKAIDDEELTHIAEKFEYILAIGSEGDDYIRARFVPGLFTLVQKNGCIYLFQSRGYKI